jgi:hypothetical protein
MQRFASALGSLALATFISAPALADCIPGTGLCASAGVTVALPPIPAVQVGGQITIGIPPIVLPLPYGAPPAQAAPPAPAYQVYQPPPPPTYVYQQAPRPEYGYVLREPVWGSRLALDVRVDGAGGFGHDVAGKSWGLGGVGVGFRYRATPHFGIELGADLLGGRDYNDHKTTQFSGNLGGLLYVNPRSRAQFYFSGGLLGDYAKATGNAETAPNNEILQHGWGDLQYNHVGGYAGLGLEWFATRHLAFHADVRGLVRQNVSGDAATQPEFTDPVTGHTTNTSTGLVGSVGALFYF